MKKNKEKFRFYKRRIDKINSSHSLYYYALSIVVYLISTILISYTYFSINYRYNQSVRLPFVHGQDLPDGFISLSVELNDEEIIISTDDRKIFKWSVPNFKEENIKKFKHYLISRLDQITFESILSMRFSEQKGFAVLSVDAKLAVIHILPVIQALAAAGITQYAFAGEKITP